MMVYLFICTPTDKFKRSICSECLVPLTEHVGSDHILAYPISLTSYLFIFPSFSVFPSLSFPQLQITLKCENDFVHTQKEMNQCCISISDFIQSNILYHPTVPIIPVIENLDLQTC